MNIGCVRELKNNEYRVGMTPDNAKEYVAWGHRVYIEQGAGEGSGFDDEAYRAAGASLLGSAAEVWQAADMIIKVKEPVESEYGLMREGQILYTYLHLAAEKKLAVALMERKVKAVAYETLTNENGELPLLKPMSEIAGRLSMIEGAKCLQKPMGGAGVLLLGVPGTPKAKVVILGAGVVGMNACKMALGMHADVTIMDINLNRLTYLDDIFNGQVKTLVAFDSTIEKELEDADLVIGAVLIPGASAPKIIKKEYLKKMRPGSVVVDVAVDQGGCTETTKPTTHEAPTFKTDGVVQYCVANMPGAVARTSTVALTNATLAYGVRIASEGLEAAALEDAGIANGINIYGGKCVHKNVADSLELAYTPLHELL